ncbi:hypothetical protein KI387_004878, partial [Taxus chinensis]
MAMKGWSRVRFLVVVVIMASICSQWSSSEGDHMNPQNTISEHRNSTAIYKDPHQPVEDRVEDLLSEMTLAEKIGQMTQIERVVATPAIIKELGIGSILNGGGSIPGPKASARVWADMVDSFQDGALSTRLGIPMIFGTDAVHGHNNVYGATIFPHNIGLGATRDIDLVKRIGVATALEVRATGIPYAFAPCVAVCRDPRWGRCYECYSEDTEVVEKMTEIITGLQGSPSEEHPNGYPYVGGGVNVVACAKHFVGDGGTTGGINEHNTLASYNDLFQVHMRPYLYSLAKGVSTIMVSYSSWNGEKMHANHYLLTRILKEELGFKGFIISDWEGIDRITSPPGTNYTYSVLASINAGVDMVMVPFQFQTFINNLTDLVKTDQISMSRIDDAVRRILRVKFIAGLFEQPKTNRSLLGMVGNPAHRVIAREAVRKSLVLLKNGKTPEKLLLPLNKNAKRILVAGSHADNLGYQCGGWTISWEGSSGATTIGTTILDAIKRAVSPVTQVVYEENPDPNFLEGKEFSYAIVVVGETPYVESTGDNSILTIPLNGTEVINNICDKDIKCLVIMISGRPLVVEPYLNKMDAFVAAWLPGSEGEGVTDVIFGDYDFQGKLPRTWFKTVDQLPMNFGDKHYDPLFPFGFGLSMNIPEKLNLEKGGTPPRFLLIDDGWQSVDMDQNAKANEDVHSANFADRLTNIKENYKFQKDGKIDERQDDPALGLRHIVLEAKASHNLKYVYVWHAITGYWGGVKHDVAGMEHYSPKLSFPVQSYGVSQNQPDDALDSIQVNGLGLVHPKKVFQFYNDLHSYLASAGIDGVKVDVQNIFETLGAGHGGRVRLASQYHQALEASIARNFPDNGIIACMSHNIDGLYSSKQTAVIRASDDFWPRDPASHTIHIASVAYNSVFLGEFMQPDWDMFHSLHPMAEYHAAARAVGGCSVYVSDKPGHHDFDVLKKLVLPDGSVLRAELPGRPTKDCLFADPARDGKNLLKIWNLNKHTGVLGVFNCQGAGWCRVDKKNLIHDFQSKTNTATICPKDVDYLPKIADENWNGDSVVYSHKGGDLVRLPRGAALPITLKSRDFEVFTVVPLKELANGITFAPIGLIRMFNSGGAISAYVSDPTSTPMSLKAR